MPLLPPPASEPRVVGASVIGADHVRQGLPCQDAWAAEVFPCGAVIAVADGLGSAARSGDGAQRAVAVAIAAVRDRLAGGPHLGAELGAAARAGVEAARRGLEQAADESHCALRDLACTLLVVVLQGNRAAAAHIGDGAAAVRTGAGWSLLSGPGDAEYVNEVVPLTARNWPTAVRISPELSGLTGLLAFTDGCQRAALQREGGDLQPFPGFCEPVLDYVAAAPASEVAAQAIQELLASAKLGQNSDDDKTLVVATLLVLGDEG